MELTFWFQPGSPGVTSKGTSTIRPLFDGLFVEEKIDGALNGTPFTTRSWTAHGHGESRAVVLVDATLSLERRPWNAAEIRRALVRHPVMTGHVMAGIHWQALKLWWKVAMSTRARSPRERQSQANGIKATAYPSQWR